MQRRAIGQQFRNARGGREHLLKIIQHEQASVRVQECFELLEQDRRLYGLQAERLSDGGEDETWIEQRRERNEEDLSEVLPYTRRDLESQARFPHPARTGKRDQTHRILKEQLPKSVHFLCSPEQGGEWRRQVGFGHDRP
jgi:hypothetical protein